MWHAALAPHIKVSCCTALYCSVLYGDELKVALEANPKHMRLDIALSLEQQNAQGGPEYVQVRQQLGHCSLGRSSRCRNRFGRCRMQQ
jgi:hypothetical protein